MVKLATQQIGRCGELLVQYMLLKYGVESAPMTTDFGIDLIAFNTAKQQTVTIQVKTSTYHDPNDKWLRWEILYDCPADYVALVDLDRNKFWLIKLDEFKQIGARAAKGYLRLWWSLPGYESERSKRKEEQFKGYESDTVIQKVFNLP